MASNDRKIKRKIRNAYLVSTVSIALVLFLLGAVGYMILNAREASNSLKENVSVSVLLKDDIEDDTLKTLGNTLGTRKEVKKYEYISKDKAAEDFKSYIGNDFVSFLEGNPLPASFELTLNATYSEIDSIRVMSTEIKKMDGVEDILYQESIIEQVTKNINKFNLILIIFGGTLLLISLILINNTIRMAIFSRRNIINTMKLVGATGGFIMRPFMGRAFAQGIYAGIISCLLVTGVVYSLNKGLPEAAFITDIEILGIIYGGIFLLGIVISMIFTYYAVRKYIRLSSNQLYIY
ncbi:MAG: ABC transporter permease [Rikenellaceae bacterium]|nr:ABC transporter permease [Rikenellaceae bacterium]